MTATATTSYITTPLSNICRPKQWPTISKSQLADQGYPVFGANGLIGYYDQYNHEHPTLLITCRGATCGTLNISPVKCYVTGNAMALDNLDDSRADLKYLYYFLQHRGFSDVITGTAQPQITRQTLHTVTVDLPPLSEQRRIAAILDKADALRRKRRRALQLTDTFLRSVFLDMFGDPSINPKKWPTALLGDLIRKGDRLNYGVVQPGNDVPAGIPIVRVGDFDGMSINPSNLKRIDPTIEAKYKRSRLRGDEVLIACVGSIGLVALAEKILAGFNIVRAVARVPCGDAIRREYLAYYLASEHIQRYFLSETRTVANPTLNIKQITETSVLVPPHELQVEFGAIYHRWLELRSKQDVSGTQSDYGFDALVQRAFRGDL